MLRLISFHFPRLSLLLILFSHDVMAKEIAVEPLELTRINDYVYSAIGATHAPSYANRGHNNNLSIVISDQGVLVVNGGDNYLLAASLHAAIKNITSQPVVAVVNENGQGHAFLGNSYWSEQGVRLIAHEDAVTAIKNQGHEVLARMQKRNKELAKGTFIAIPTETFRDKKTIQLGSITVELIHFGKAHTAGDISVWLPLDRIIITGDIAFHERMLGIFPETNTEAWLESFEKLQALKPLKVIPGHGSPTDLATITHYTYDYIKYLRDKIEQILDADGDLPEAYQIDQSQWQQLDVFDILAVKNAGRIFQEMEMASF